MIGANGSGVSCLGMSFMWHARKARLDFLNPAFDVCILVSVACGVVLHGCVV